MANAGTLQILVVGDTSPLVASMKAGVKSTGELNTAAGKLGLTLENINAPFARLKKIFGARGPLKDLTELAVGGGAFAGITFLTGTIERAAEGAKKLSMEFRSGAKSTGELVDESLRLLPVFGNLYSAGRSIREVITGEEADLARATAEAQRLSAAYAEMAKFAGSVKGMIADAADTTFKMSRDARRTALDLMPDGPAKDRAKIAFDIKSESVDAERALSKAFKDATADASKNIDGLKAQLKNMMPPTERVIPWAGFVGGAAILASESPAQFGKRVADFELEKSRIETAIAQAEQQIKQAKEKIFGENGSAVASIESAATAKLNVELEKLGKTQADMNAAANESSINAAFEKWTEKFNEAKDRAKEIADDLRTPGQKIADFQKELNGLVSSGVFSKDLANAALNKFRNELIKKPELASAIKLSFASTSDANIGTGATDTLAAQVTAAVNAVVDGQLEKRQLDELQRIRTSQENIDRKLRVGDSK